jgi:glycerate kinase
LKTRKILIAPNSFKECAHSVTIAELFKQNLSGIPELELDTKPISDGGDGFLEVCKYHFGGTIISFSISRSFDDCLFICPVLYNEEKKVVYIESAEVLGLKMVPLEYRNPLTLSSKGLGELLLRIQEELYAGNISIDRAYIGIGGTATIDMGLGMMSMLGLKLYDDKKKELPVIPANYSFARSIVWSKANFSFEIIPVIDVNNPLLGDKGIKTFAKQKGATEMMIKQIESGFDNIINLIKNNNLQVLLDSLQGAGGGISAAFEIFYNSYIESSKEFIMNNLKITDPNSEYTYLLTGEGSFDKQSLYGKGAGLLLEHFTNKVEKIFLVCGKIEDEIKDVLPENVHPIELTNYFENELDSIKNFEKGIILACNEVKKKIVF